MKAMTIGDVMAVLTEDDTWTCSDPIMEADLNQVTKENAEAYSVGDGTFREFIFQAAVKAFKGAPFDDEEPATLPANAIP